MKKTILTILTLTLISTCIAAVKTGGKKTAAKGGATMEYTDYLPKHGHFKCVLPKAWQALETGDTGERQKIYGIEAAGQPDSSGVRVRVSVDYYAKDNAMYETPEAFVANLSKADPLLPIKGEKYGPVKPVKAAGMTGKQFERKVFEFIPPESVKPAKVAVVERYAVLTAKEGFYVLTYKAPEKIAASNSDIFKKVLDSFKTGK